MAKNNNNEAQFVGLGLFNLLPSFSFLFYFVVVWLIARANAKLKLKMWRKGSSEGSGRFEYLQTLVTEFQDTDSEGEHRELNVCKRRDLTVFA